MTDIATRLQNLIEADPDPAMVELYTTSLREIERLRAALQSARMVLSGLRLRNEQDKAVRSGEIARIERALEPKP